MIERSRFSGEEGISLVEMLVAVMLLGIIMAALARSLTGSMFSVQEQQAQVRATALAQEVLEQAAGLAWKDLGLCETDATGLHPTGTYTYASGTEPLVLIPDSSSLCTPIADAPIRAAFPYSRDGITYTATTVVSWSDEDGVGSPEDLKHVFVEVDWMSRGAQRTTVAETYLAPNALEAVLSTEVVHAPGQTYTYLDAGTGLTKTDVTLRVVAIRPQSGVTVRWRDADGNYLTPQPMTAMTSDGLVWELVIQNGSPEFAVNRLANGETLFEFTATDADNGSTFEAFDRGLFLLDPAGIEASLVAPASVAVDAQGVLCAPVTLTVSVRGFLSSDIVSATWSEGFSAANLVSVPDDDTLSATFEATYDTAVISPPAQGTRKFLSVHVTGTRVADSQPLSQVFQYDGQTGGVEVVQGCS